MKDIIAAANMMSDKGYSIGTQEQYDEFVKNRNYIIPPMIKQANNTQGHLLRQFDGSYCFRVYNEDKTFTDYDLVHSDLVVTINDPDSAFYHNKDGSTILDHSAETLGISLDK
jgi:hypothetical protein